MKAVKTVSQMSVRVCLFTLPSKIKWASAASTVLPPHDGGILHDTRYATIIAALRADPCVPSSQTGFFSWAGEPH